MQTIRSLTLLSLIVKQCTLAHLQNNQELYSNENLLSGHNFGSEHDPETDECAPADTTADGGKYIMYPASVSGQLPNNKVMLLRKPSALITFVL